MGWTLGLPLAVSVVTAYLALRGSLPPWTLAPCMVVWFVVAGVEVVPALINELASVPERYAGYR